MIPQGCMVLFHGVLAANAAAREQVVPEPPKRKCCGVLRSPRLPHTVPGTGCLHWADLMARVFQADVLACPHCESRMTVRAVVLPGAKTLEILRGLEKAARGPPTDAAVA